MTLTCSDDALDIRPYLDDMRRVVKEGGHVLWDRDGEVGKLSNTQLRAFLGLYDDYRAMVKHGKQPDLPTFAYLIPWAATRPTAL